MEISDQHFDKERRHDAFLYPDLYLNLMIPFQVVRDGQLMDDE